MKYSDNQQKAIKQILTEVLSATRPGEVVLVDSVFDEGKSETEILGFGPGVELELAISALLPILERLASTAANRFAEEWGAHLAEWLFAKEKHNHSLNSECLIQLREAVVMRLRDQGFDPANADRIGDSVSTVIISHPSLVRELTGQ
jgi:hypothetical protein